MRVSVRFQFAIGLLIVAMAMSAMSLGATAPVAAKEATRYVIVGANNILPVDLEAMVAAAGGKVVEQFDEIGVAIVESSEPAFAEAAAGISGVQGVAVDEFVFLGAPDEAATVIESAGEESVVSEGHNPASAQFFAVAQWNMRAIGADRAWAAGFKGDPRVRVAVIDTGIDYTHQELVNKVDLVASASFFVEPVPVGAFRFADMNGHGTHIAGLIGGVGRSVAGVAPHVTLIAVKVGGKNGFAPWSAILAGMFHAVNVNADIINMSFGAKFTKEELKADHLKQALHRAIHYARNRGVFLVASAGNEGIDWDSKTMKDITKVPAQVNHVYAVSASGPEFGGNFDAMAAYSDFGDKIVSFAAPGGNITAFRAPNGMPVDAILSACSSFARPGIGPGRCGSKRANIFMVGTSMAAAHVSGVAALVDSAFGGALRGEEIAAILRRSADDLGKPGKDELYGFGRVNAYRAVTLK